MFYKRNHLHRRSHIKCKVCRFITKHEARKRYWARSFLGWTNLHRARPNVAHMAVKDLGKLGLVSSVITQSGCIDPIRGQQEHACCKTLAATANAFFEV